MISDALFAQQAIRGFARQDRDIARLQEQLSSGVNDPRVSADPARAMELSALRDLRSDLATQTAIGRAAADRLALTDSALAEVSDGVRELYRISLQAGNDTLTREAHAALRVQAETLRSTLLAAANATDQQGRPLFSGTAPGPAFVPTAQGVAYQGDTAASAVQMGPHARMETGLAGERVFGDGRDGLFALLDDIVLALSEPVLSARDTVQADGRARLDLSPVPAGGEIALVLGGPQGAAELLLPLGAADRDAQIEAINALTARTGIHAAAAQDGAGIVLEAAGRISLSAQTGPADAAAERPVVRLAAADDAGRPTREPTALRPLHLGSQTLVSRTTAAVEHMAEMRAAGGSLAAALESRLEQVANKRLTLDQAVSRLQDVDVAEAITRLQGLLLNQKAAQQSFVRIAERSLFDYLR